MSNWCLQFTVLSHPDKNAPQPSHKLPQTNVFRALKYELAIIDCGLLCVLGTELGGDQQDIPLPVNSPTGGRK